MLSEPKCNLYLIETYIFRDESNIHDLDLDDFDDDEDDVDNSDTEMNKLLLNYNPPIFSFEPHGVVCKVLRT
ncbi:hypothetical protein BpHYR1_021523 [Brachionus plicatilis]|uniref:Uncharacterized protein n=1 Tax=Brachionus plicatilis TaxID=10195 RepID=A0A3M7SFK6_BRAPC|nr:hypothetical protein BpHYR1_021523 [Brachionus plicatilis]